MRLLPFLSPIQLLLFVLLLPFASYAQGELSSLTGTYREQFSQSPSLTGSDEKAEGAQQQRFWRFQPGKVVVTERLNDSTGCSLNDLKCTYFQASIEFKAKFDSNTGALQMSAVSRQDTFLREFGEPSFEHYERLKNYQDGEKKVEYRVQTEGVNLRLWRSNEETLLVPN